MVNELAVSIGHYSDKGRKATNQDFQGHCIPGSSQLRDKGIAVVIADGISSSELSHIASETAVTNFLTDYYCTSDAWSVKQSATRVLSAANSWLYSQTERSPHKYDKNKGYVCTLSALIVKSHTAHIFHIGDTRIYRLNHSGLEQLTKDHRLWTSEHDSYLSRGMGIEYECDLECQALKIHRDDLFILASDGVYEHIDAAFLSETISHYADDLDCAAKLIVEHAYDNGSDDNLSIQIVRIDQLPEQVTSVVREQIEKLPLPPILDARMQFDGYTILRDIHSTSRSHVYLAQDEATGKQVIIKTPSIDLGCDPAYLERFLSEEWIARRINSAHVLKADQQDRERNYLYTVFEYIEGQTLAQWIIDNPKPAMGAVRTIVEQIAKGLRAFHRMEMLHQDLKPDNVMIDSKGTVKIIDFGSVWVAGLADCVSNDVDNPILGTALYTAPEYFLGEFGTARSEQFSLGVITYYMLSGKFPYGTKVSATRTIAAQRRLVYQSVLDEEREIPLWIDEAIKKAVSPLPLQRYEEISEFIADLRQPNKAFLHKTRPPLLERNPVAFWQGTSFGLVMIIFYLLAR